MAASETMFRARGAAMTGHDERCHNNRHTASASTATGLPCQRGCHGPPVRPGVAAGGSLVLCQGNEMRALRFFELGLLPSFVLGLLTACANAEQALLSLAWDRKTDANGSAAGSPPQPPP